MDSMLVCRPVALLEQKALMWGSLTADWKADLTAVELVEVVVEMMVGQRDNMMAPLTADLTVVC